MLVHSYFFRDIRNISENIFLASFHVWFLNRFSWVQFLESYHIGILCQDFKFILGFLDFLDKSPLVTLKILPFLNSQKFLKSFLIL